MPTPSDVSGILALECGVTATLTVTSEVFGYLPRLEIYGTEAILICNDPNQFGGPVFLQPRSGERREIPLINPYRESNRGLGVAEMSCAIQARCPHRGSGELCCHVLDVIHALHESSRDGRYVEIESRADRPAPLPPGSSPLILE